LRRKKPLVPVTALRLSREAGSQITIVGYVNCRLGQREKSIRFRIQRERD